MICGIQQIGIGVTDIERAWPWYCNNFGMDIQVFNDHGIANEMLKYTGNKECLRHAILAVNIQGGGGFEIWQHKEHIPEKPGFEVRLGDFGIFAPKVKTRDIAASMDFFKVRDIEILTEIMNFGNIKHFFVRDPFENIFQIVESSDMFINWKHPNAGVAGCIIGVSDIAKSRKLYSDILGYDEVIYEKEGVFEDFSLLPGGKDSFQRVLLGHSKPRKGPFSKFLGKSQIELVKVNGRKQEKIFENRYWGDPGYIQLCFDVRDFDELREECKQKGYPFTVDTGTGFDMGGAAGRFAYIEDNDGTLIEFVESHKLPIIKKLGWYYDLKKRNSEKQLPDWMIKALRFNRKKA